MREKIETKQEQGKEQGRKEKEEEKCRGVEGRWEEKSRKEDRSSEDGFPLMTLKTTKVSINDY